MVAWLAWEMQTGRSPHFPGHVCSPPGCLHRRTVFRDCRACTFQR